MNIRTAIQTRQSVRAFLDQSVTQAQVTNILDTARWAASGTNTQPWQVIALTGEPKNQLQALLMQQFKAGVKPKMDYLYYPEVWKEPYLARRRQCGEQLYSALQIDRQDKARRLQQWMANYESFQAPVVLMFFMDNLLETGSFLDYGMFLQSIMLAAMEEGLATCPQAALGEYPDIVRQFLKLSDEKVVLCGMALGYEDKNHPVNHYRTEREAVNHFTQFMGFKA